MEVRRGWHRGPPKSRPGGRRLNQVSCEADHDEDGETGKLELSSAVVHGGGEGQEQHRPEGRQASDD